MVDRPVAVQRGTRQRDEATCFWNGKAHRVVSGSGAAMKLARLLVREGCPDQPWGTRTSTGTRSLFGPSLYRLAKLRVEESDRGGLKQRQFDPHPNLKKTGLHHSDNVSQVQS